MQLPVTLFTCMIGVWMIFMSNRNWGTLQESKAITMPADAYVHCLAIKLGHRLPAPKLKPGAGHTCGWSSVTLSCNAFRVLSTKVAHDRSIVTHGSDFTEASFGFQVLSLPASVCVFICVCVHECGIDPELVRTITQHPSKLEPPSLDKRCKTPWLFLG